MPLHPVSGAIYKSRRNGVRLLVEEVTELEDDGFFLVFVAPPDDIQASGNELTNDEWAELVRSLDLARE